MVEERDKVLETIIAPDLILQGDKGATMAIRFYPKTKLTSKYLVVVYKEISPSDGFILTAFYANQYSKWRKVIWKK